MFTDSTKGSIIDYNGRLTIAVSVFFVTVFIMTQMSLRSVTDLAREKNMDSPLPDIYHTVLPTKMREWHEYADWLPIIPLVMFLAIDRFKNAGDFITMISLIYLMRAISFSLTVLPSPDTSCKCEWEDTPNTFLRSILNILYQEGCNDLIFSGHTSMMLMSSLFIMYYYLQGKYLQQFMLIMFNCIGVFVIIGTRLHYSVDVFIATIITTLLFFAFHK